MLWLSQLRALVIKNIILKRRNLRQVLAEIGYPIYFVFFLVLMQYFSGDIDLSVPEVDKYRTCTVPTLSQSCNKTGQCDIAFAPNTTETYALMQSILDRSRIDPLVDQHSCVYQYFSPVFIPSSPSKLQFTAFDSEDDLNDYYNKNPTAFWAAVLFDADDLTDFTILVNQTYGSFSSSNSTVFSSSGFLAIQTSLTNALVNQSRQAGSPEVKIEVSIQEYPTPAKSISGSLIIYFFPIFMPFTFMYGMTYLIISVCTEKEKKLVEAMKMMGLKDWVYWLSYLCTQSVMNLIIVTGVVAVCWGFSIIRHSDLFLVFSLIFLFTVSLISMGSLFSVFFNKPRTAAVVASLSTLLFIGVYALGYFYFFKDDSWQAKFLTGLVSLASFVPFMQICLVIAVGEGDGSGFGFSDLSSPSYYPAYEAILFLVFDTILYAVLAWYLTLVLPGEYGTSRSPFFFLMPSYWKTCFHSKPSPDSVPLRAKSHSQDVGIKIEDLSKVYRTSMFRRLPSDVTAVDRLNLEIYEGEIFALLGHNGAGKSTTIGMLTGLFPATSGEAYIRGNSIFRDMDEIRKSLGVCPQHDILWDELTAMEHLRLYASIKGIAFDSIKAQANQLLLDVGLEEKDKNERSKNFSGGMKRKLSVAIAFIGDCEVVFLDECTAGMDPYSRRAIWKLLQREKENKTIVMTTHFMEEADLLGDRIAIMAKGRVRCIGTSLELKKTFGVGYHLCLVKQHGFNDIGPLRTLLRDFFGDKARFDSESALEINFQLEYDCAQSFGDFFKVLETSLDSLGIRSFGIYMTTLEEVFLKIADEAEHENDAKVSALDGSHESFQLN